MIRLDQMSRLLELIMPNIELVWAAGFFDGEGSTGCEIYKDSRTRVFGRQIQLQIGQTNYIPLVRFREAVQGGNIYGPYVKKKENQKDIWQWKVGAIEEIRIILDKLWPYLCEPKKLQATEALQRYENWIPSKAEWDFELPE